MILRLSKLLSTIHLNTPLKATFAETTSGSLGGLAKAKKKAKVMAVSEKREFPVESDPYKLVNYVCGSNLLKEGGQDIQIKDDSEYPDWLWTLRTGRAPKLEELDPTTKAYWLKLRKLARKRNNQLSKLRKF